MKKTIVIPCYNESKTIETIVKKVLKKINDDDDIIIIDDCSNDGTIEILKRIKSENQKIQVYFHNHNLGKGGALQTAFKQQLNEIIIIQDADLEYDPEDYSKLLLPFIEADADVVYGSRFLGAPKYIRVHFFWHYVANKILTFFCNAFANLNLTDMETGYKLFRKKAIENLELKEKSFGFEPEITLKLAKKKLKFFEVSISYIGRSYEEGKKIKLKDAFSAFYCILKYGLFK